MSTESIVRFSDLALSAPIQQVVQEVGYESPSPIQAESIPVLLEGRDLLGMAQTGTGKTAAFALPLLSRLDLGQSSPQILVLAPTRELAIQVAEAMQTYARHLKGFHILPVYGGQGMDTQLRQLKRGVHVVVGTPGRIQDHLRRGTLKLDGIKAVVLDEADEMLRMGFIDDVEAILKYTPENRQVALFSATMPEAIRRIANTHLNEPVEIRIKSKTSTVPTIRQRYLQVTGAHKMDALTRILEVEDFDGMIVFVRTKLATEEIAEKLEARGYAASALNGDINQAQREKTVEKLKRGQIDILVATDVVARGLDVERISHVFNYDIPYDTEAYVHRIGRTGRAGRKGDAILFVAPRERRMLSSIERATGQPIEAMQLPSREAIADKRVMQFKQQITDTLESEELGFFEELIEGYANEHNTGMNEVAAALVYLLQKEKPLIAEKGGRPERPHWESNDAPQRPSPRKFDKEKGPRHARPGDERRAEKGRPGKARSDEPHFPEAGMQTYRLDVGREHGVQPKNIVGAIANESGLDSRHIGHIRIHDDYSTVDLPESLPAEMMQAMRKIWVCQRPLNISPLGGGDKKLRLKKTAAKKDKPRKGKLRSGDKASQNKPRKSRS